MRIEFRAFTPRECTDAYPRIDKIIDCPPNQAKKEVERKFGELRPDYFERDSRLFILWRLVTEPHGFIIAAEDPVHWDNRVSGSKGCDGRRLHWLVDPSTCIDEKVVSFGMPKKGPKARGVF